MGLLVLRIVAIPISAETNVSQIEEINANMKITSDTLQALVTAGMLSDNSFAIFSPLPVEPNQAVTTDPHSYGIHPEPESVSSKCARIAEESQYYLGGEYYATINGVDYCKIFVGWGSDTYLWLKWPVNTPLPPADKTFYGTITVVAPKYNSEMLMRVDGIDYATVLPKEKYTIAAAPGYHAIDFRNKLDLSIILYAYIPFIPGNNIPNYDFSNATEKNYFY